jgi:hypothetical protein
MVNNIFGPNKNAVSGTLELIHECPMVGLGIGVHRLGGCYN